MPYKNPQKRTEWERTHRLQRLARRRELRRQEAAQATVPCPPDPGIGVDLTWQLLAGGGLLAIYSPSLALGGGALILIAAALLKKTWHWWVVGGVIAAVALFRLLSDQPREATHTIAARK